LTRAAGAAAGLASSLKSAAMAAERIQKAVAATGGAGFGGGFGGGGGGGGPAMPLGSGGGSGPIYLPGSNGGSNLPAVIPGQGAYGPGGPQPWGHVPFPGGSRSGGGQGSGSGQNGYVPDWSYYQPQPGQDASFSGGGGPVPLYPNQRGGSGFSPMDAMSGIFIAQAATSMIASAAKAATAPSFGIQDQLTNIANMSPAGSNILGIQNQALAAAIKIQQSLPGLTIPQGLAMISDLYSVDRNMGAATALAPGYARDGYLMSKAQGGGDAIDQLWSVFRSSEELGYLNLLNKNGGLNTSRAMSFVDMYTKLVTNSNGHITGAGALTMIGQAGPGASQMSDKALMQAALISQALGPSQTGTGLQALYQEFIGGKMSQATARALHDAGVLPDFMFGKDDKILKKYRYGIGYAMIPAGDLKDEKMALVDPIGFAQKYLFAKFLNPDGTIKTGDDKAVENLIGNLNRDFSRVPGMKAVGQAILESAQIDRQYQNIANAASLSVQAKNDASTPNSAVAGAGAAVNGLLQALGSPLVPGATKGLQMFTTALNDFSNTMRSHPDFAKDIDKTIGILGAFGAGAAGKATLAKFGMDGFLGGEAVDPVGGGFLGAMLAVIAEKFISKAMGGGGAAGKGPSGSSSDPVHVVLHPLAGGTPWMPTTPTSPNANKSLPPPGRPLTNK
jgi:hypothetical protein